MVFAPSRPFHWPGGIPPEVKSDANKDITPEEANETAKGWLLFVSGTWVTREDANVPDHDRDYEVRQRRALVETWAKEEKAFRDVDKNILVMLCIADRYPVLPTKSASDQRSQLPGSC